MAAKTKAKPETNGTPKASDTDIMTMKEAAEFLRVPVDGLRKDAEAGRVPARQVAGEWRFSKSVLLAWFTTPSKPLPGSKGAFLSLAGLWKDDPTVDAMIEDIYRRRKAGTVAG